MQECWKINACLKLRIDGFNGPFLALRKNKQGGGVGIYYKNGLNCKIMDSPFVQDIIETISIKIKTKDKFIKVINVYRPPKPFLSTDIELIFDNVDNNTIFVGDFNVNYNGTGNKTVEYKAQLNEFGLKNIINLPTRLDSNTCLDHVLINKLNNNITAKVLNEAVSDHQVIMINIEDIGIMDKQAKSFRVLNNEAFNTIKNNIENYIPNGNSIDDIYENFVSEITQQVNMVAPLKTIKKNKRFLPINPWMTVDLMNMRKRLQNLTAKVKNGRNDLIANLRLQKNNYKKGIYNAKNEYYKLQLQEATGNSKKTWEILNDALHRKDTNCDIPDIISNGTILTTEAEKSTAFVNHFTNAATELRPLNFDSEAHKVYLPNRFIEWGLVPVQEDVIKKTIKSLKPKGSTGYDDISNKLIKKSLINKTGIIKDIINKSITTGVFPNKMKVAKILPLFKKGASNSMDNYRPISLLPTMSKILEKVVKNQIEFNIEQQDIIPKNQFGFKKNNSTIHANLKLMEKVLDARRDNKLVAIILIDVRKAFDSCNHDVILSKLKCSGANQLTINWVKSYLTNRRQYVQINKTTTQEMLVNLGVGQGTVLGPLLFKLYLMDVPLCTILFMILFADDTTLVAVADSLAELEVLCNNELNKVDRWFELNGLTLHPEKTKIMVIGCNNKINVVLKGITVKQCGSNFPEKSINVLGIEWDDKLNWSEHIKKVLKKTGTGIYLMSKFRRLLTINSRKILYNSIIKPHLTYGIELWGNSNGALMNRLKTKHKQSIRLMIPGKIHTKPIMKRFGIIDIKSEYNKALDILAWKILRDLAPLTIKESLTWRNNERQLRNSRVVLPRFRTENLRQQFLANLAKAINKITNEELNWSIGKFKNQLKKKYINEINGDITCNNIGCRECT